MTFPDWMPYDLMVLVSTLHVPNGQGDVSSSCPPTRQRRERMEESTNMAFPE
jgi:hypothetical protein